MQTRHAIRPLDPQVIGQIAAGEVVERPALAVKELVENSIDAGATAVSVEIRDGGLSYFRVTDNGCGIVRGEIRMAFARHATSKLRTAEELRAIHTLGFRGEALASIAAVAHVELTTRAAQEESGVKAVVRGGVIESIQDAPSPEGTSVTVRDLFFNTPARRKFLKKPATEAGLVSDMMLRLILARPDIAFRLVSGGKTVYHSPGNNNLRDALLSVLGTSAMDALTEVRGSAAGCAIYGFVGVGDTARSSRAMQTFILNGRYVKNAFLSQALDEGCRERVMIGKYPVCALHLTMPFEAVDVNVHPNKLEVRFQDERALMEGIAGILRASFEVEPMRAAPSLPLPPDPARAAAPAAPAPIRPASWLMDKTDRPKVVVYDSAVAPPIATDRPPVFAPIHPEEPAQQEQTVLEPVAKAPLKVVGVAWQEYVFVEREDALYIIDQHAAHERILYERFSRAMDRHTASQRLLAGQVVQLTHREYAALMDNRDALEDAGFELDDFGDNAVLVRAVPMVLGVPQLQAYFGELADRLSELRALPSQEKRRDALVKLACRKAVKAGDALSRESIESLLDEMLRTGAPPTCPHGRPLVIQIKKAELDKRFRRIV